MDLNVMMREQARTGLQTQLDAATTEGDIKKVREIADKIAKLDVDTTPRPAVSYGQAEINAALEAKADWFGADPIRSGLVLQLGKDMNPKRFATAELFADALLKAVEAKLKPEPAAGAKEEDDEEEDEDEDDKDDKDGKPERKPRKTDAPSDIDRGGARGVRNGPWAKLSDAPQATRTDIERQISRLLPRTATKDQKADFTKRALESAYRAHQQRTKGKS